MKRLSLAVICSILLSGLAVQSGFAQNHPPTVEDGPFTEVSVEMPDDGLVTLSDIRGNEFSCQHYQVRSDSILNIVEERCNKNLSSKVVQVARLVFFEPGASEGYLGVMSRVVVEYPVGSKRPEQTCWINKGVMELGREVQSNPGSPVDIDRFLVHDWDVYKSPSACAKAIRQ